MQRMMHGKTHSMINLIKVELKNQYGRILAYPRCATSVSLCELIKQNSFTSDDIRKLKEIGFEIETIERKAVKL